MKKLIKLSEEKGFKPSYDVIDYNLFLFELHKWLRDDHNMHVMPDCNGSGWFYTIIKAGNVSKGDYSGGTNIFSNYASELKTYEEALEAGLAMALILIK